MAKKWCKKQAPIKCLLNWKIYFGELTKKLMPSGEVLLFQHNPIFSHVHHKYSSQHTKLCNMQETKNHVTYLNYLKYRHPDTNTPFINLIFW